MTRIAPKQFLPVVCILLLGVLFRTYSLSAQSVWSDEFVCVAYLKAPTWSEFNAEYKKYDPYMPPLYHATLYGWARLTGDGAVSLRMLSMAFGLAAMVMIFILGKELLGMPLALFPLALFAFSPEQIYHAQGIRCYALAVLLALLSTFAFLRMLREGHWGWWLANAFFNVLLVWTHMGGVILGVTWGLGILIWLRRFRAKLLVWGIVQLICVAPLLSIVAVTIHNQTMDSQMQGTATGLVFPFLLLVIIPFFKDTSYVLYAQPPEYAINAGLVTYAQSLLKSAAALSAAALAMLFIIGVIAACRRVRSDISPCDVHGENTKASEVKPGHAVDGRRCTPRIFLLFWFLVPSLLLLIPAYFINISALNPRYSIYAAPALFFLTAHSIQQMKWKQSGRGLGGMILVLMFLFGLTAAVMPLRGNYLAAGAIMGSGGEKRPCAVMGDSPLLAAQIAYNSTLNEEDVKHLYTLEEVQQWLENEVKTTGRGWFLLENTDELEDTDLLLALEVLFSQEGMLVARHFFFGPQNLFVYDLAL